MDQTNGFVFTKKECLSDKIHDSILEMIIQNPSGEEQVLTENKLVELFGVSKAPVREALIKLCSEGVLKSVPRYGYVVIQMTESQAEEVMGIRILLEIEALKESFPRLTGMKLDSLKRQIDKSTSISGKNLWEVWTENEEFHLMLASFSGNNVLMKFLNECMSMERRIYAQHIWDSRKTMETVADGADHTAIYQKLIEGDLDGAIVLLSQDIQNV